MNSKYRGPGHLKSGGIVGAQVMGLTAGSKKMSVINVYIFCYFIYIYIYTFIMCQLLISKLLRCLYTTCCHASCWFLLYVLFLIVIFLLCSRQKAWKKNLNAIKKFWNSVYASLMGVGHICTSCLHQCSFFELKVHYYTFFKKYTRLTLIYCIQI